MLISVLVFILALAKVLDGKAINTTSYITRGHLLLKDTTTGKYRSLRRDDIESLGKIESRMKLYLDNEPSPLDMIVSQSSILTKESTVVVQHDPEKSEVVYNLGSHCFLHGRVLDPEGVASVTKCGPMTGVILVPGFVYDIEEDHAVHRDNILTFKVIKRAQDQQELDEDFTQNAFDVVEKEILDGMDVNDDKTSSDKTREKRDVNSIVIELALVMDSNYLQYLYYHLNLDTHIKLVHFLLSKWHTVQDVLSDAETVGANVRILVKRMEYWWHNHPGYPADHVDIQSRFRWFCRNSSIPEVANHDLKVLYTRGTGGHQLSTSDVGGICLDNRKCIIVKSPTPRVFLELHGLGHSLGLHHDNRMGDCESPGGFMGWEDTYRYLPCYRRALRRNLGNDSFSCLFQTNVPEYNSIHTTDTPADQIESEDITESTPTQPTHSESSSTDASTRQTDSTPVHQPVNPIESNPTHHNIQSESSNPDSSSRQAESTTLQQMINTTESTPTKPTQTESSNTDASTRQTESTHSQQSTNARESTSTQPTSTDSTSTPKSQKTKSKSKIESSKKKDSYPYPDKDY